jgi:hypothetical protein
MTAPAPSNTPSSQLRGGVRGPELGPVQKRDVLLQRARAARKRLSPIPNAVARLR